MATPRKVISADAPQTKSPRDRLLARGLDFLTIQLRKDEAWKPESEGTSLPNMQLPPQEDRPPQIRLPEPPGTWRFRGCRIRPSRGDTVQPTTPGLTTRLPQLRATTSGPVSSYFYSPRVQIHQPPLGRGSLRGSLAGSHFYFCSKFQDQQPISPRSQLVVKMGVFATVARRCIAHYVSGFLAVF